MPLTVASDPFAQGLDRAVVLRLLAGPRHFTKADLRKYRSTEHWAATKGEALKAHGYRCGMCTALAAQVHHRHYRTLFRESMEDLRILCRNCHKRHHGK